MFTLLVTVLAVLTVAGILFRITDSTSTGSGTTGSRALRPDNTPSLPVHPRGVK